MSDTTTFSDRDGLISQKKLAPTCSVEDVAAALSHSSTSTTKQYYLHNAVDPGARRVSRRMNQVTPAPVTDTDRSAAP